MNLTMITTMLALAMTAPISDAAAQTDGAPIEETTLAADGFELSVRMRPAAPVGFVAGQPERAVLRFDEQGQLTFRIGPEHGPLAGASYTVALPQTAVPADAWSRVRVVLRPASDGMQTLRMEARDDRGRLRARAELDVPAAMLAQVDAVVAQASSWSPEVAALATCHSAVHVGAADTSCGEGETRFEGLIAAARVR